MAVDCELGQGGSFFRSEIILQSRVSRLEFVRGVILAGVFVCVLSDDLMTIRFSCFLHLCRIRWNLIYVSCGGKGWVRWNLSFFW